MLAYATKRVVQAIPILLLVSLISFGIMYLVPGDPAVILAGPNATGEDIARVRETLGLVERAYIIHAGQVLTHGLPSEIVGNPDVRRLYLGETFTL